MRELYELLFGSRFEPTEFLKRYMLTFTGDVQLENLILKESALVSLFVQFAFVARS